ncbi:MAG: EpsG family protein [Idiomarina sp.]|nr:EpsG family protein [Idiomarina sp.]
MRYSLDRWILLAVAFLILVLPSALRYNIGTDFMSYVNIYENLDDFTWMEQGFYFVNWTFRSLGAHVQWVFTAFAFIFTAVAFKAYPSRNVWLVHFVFMAMLWFPSFNIMRQTIALAFCMLAVFCYLDRRVLLFFVYTAIGALFHKSAFFVMACGALALIPVRTSLKYTVAPLAFTAILAVALLQMDLILGLIEHLLRTAGLTKYANYFGGRHFIARDFGSGLGVLAKVAFSVYVLLSAKSFLRFNKYNWLLLILVFVYALGVILANQIMIFGRMADTFVVAPVVAAYVLYQLPNNRQLNKLVLVSFLAFLLLSFTKDGFGTVTSYSDPHRNPYQTIFSSDVNE